MRLPSPVLLRKITCFSLLIAALTAAVVRGADAPSAEGVAYFEKHIRPLLIERCYECHGAEKQKGGLRLDSREATLQGGDNGPALVPGKAEESLLVKAVSYTDPDLKMPPKEKLPSHQVARLKEWINIGAPDPRTGTALAAKAGIDLEAGRKFWAFQPPRKSPLPKVKDTQWPRTDIDRFILARLEEKKLRPSPDADKATLLRRVHYDLTGLPPTPEQLDAFIKDTRSDAFARVVDGLLASPHFGEHWGRHWLDIARYAESSGGGRTLLFKDAWRYRDYVVNSLNRDKPFDQFIREQVAGDLLPHHSPEQRQERLVALAYLALGATNYEEQDKDVLEMDVVDEQLDLIGKGLLGMTIGCARCHDHKFDPIPTRDYYALAGIFTSTHTLIHDNVSRWVDNELPASPEEERALQAHAAELAALQDRIKLAKAATAQSEPARKGPIAPASLPGIVLDETKGKIVGEWTHSTFSKNYVGDGYLHDANSGKGTKTITFVPDIPKEGRYEVRFAWVPSSNRASNTPVEILHADGEATLRVNQREEPPIGERFISLGQYRFTPGGQWFVLISNEGTDGHVIVDAVQFIPLDDSGTAKLAGAAKLPLPAEVDRPEMIAFIVPDPRALPGIVVDDTQAELVGEWKHSVHTPPFVGAGYLHDDKTGKGGKSATFRPNLPEAGEYEVRLAHNYNVRRATNAPVTIRHARGETRVVVNQQEESPHGKLFRTLGKFHFEAGTGGFVRISNDGTDGKNVIADAVQFIPTFQPEAGKAPLAKGTSDRAAEVKKLEAQLKQLQAKAPNRPLAMGVREAKKIGDTAIRIRGVTANKGALAPRGFLQVASNGPAPVIPKDQSGRRELADWLTSADNPLTARVFANRAWHWLTGSGLVRTVDNFGATGEPPSHPELLDALAIRFVEDGWSVKKLVREIVLSRAYQMSSAPHAAGHQADPDNRLLWRMNRTRLDAESIRDAILQVTGKLDRKMGGPSVKQFNMSPGIHVTPNVDYVGFDIDNPANYRRAVYRFVFRTLPDPFLEAMDCPDASQQAPVRSSSVTALQALAMLNDKFIVRQSEHLAERLQREAKTPREQIRLLYSLTLHREPTAKEIELMMNHAAKFGLPNVCRIVLNCNEFLFVP